MRRGEVSVRSAWALRVADAMVVVLLLASAVAAQVPITCTGRVVDVTRAPLAGARVVFVPDGDTLRERGIDVPRKARGRAVSIRFAPFLDAPPLDTLQVAVTDANGRFAFDATWRRAATTPLWSAGPDTPCLVVLADGFEVRGVTLGDEPLDPHVDLGDVTMRIEHLVAGRIVDEDGAPLRGARIRVLGGNAEAIDGDARPRRVLHAELDETSSGRDGTFTLRGVWPGSLVLDVRRADRVRVERWVLVDQPFVELDDVVLPRGSSVAGRVVDVVGLPLPDVAVSASRELRDTYGLFDRRFAIPPDDDALAWRALARFDFDAIHARTDVDGRFVLDGIPWDHTALVALADGFEVGLLDDVESGARDLSLVLEDEAVLHVAVGRHDRRDPYVRGASVRAERSPRRHADAEARDVVPLTRAVDPEREGLVPLEVERVAPWSFVVHRVGRRETLLHVEAPGYVSRSVVCAGLATGDESSRVFVRLERAAIVGGFVRDADGTPMPRAVVLVLDEDDDAHAPTSSTHTDAEGRFRLDTLPPGTWSLLVHAEGRPARLVTLDARVGDTTCDVTLPESAELRVRLAPVLAERLGFECAHLTTPDDLDRRHALETSFATGSRPFDEGVAVFTGVPPGRWIVSAGNVRAEVELVAGETREVVLGGG